MLLKVYSYVIARTRYSFHKMISVFEMLIVYNFVWWVVYILLCSGSGWLLFKSKRVILQLFYSFSHDNICFVLEQHTGLDCYRANRVKHQYRDTFVLLGQYYPDSKPISICSYSCILHALQGSTTYQFHSLRFDPTAVWTHDLPHTEWIR